MLAAIKLHSSLERRILSIEKRHHIYLFGYASTLGAIAQLYSNNALFTLMGVVLGFATLNTGEAVIHHQSQQDPYR